MLENALELATAQQARLMDALRSGKTRMEFYADQKESLTAELISECLLMAHEQQLV